MESAPLALVLYSVQILVVVGVAALASALGRLAVPAVRLAYWRGIGLLCVALPLFAAGRGDRAATSVVFGSLAGDAGAGAVTQPALLTIGSAILWIWVVGAVARLAWLLAGAARLRQLRRGSVLATLGAGIDGDRHAIAPRAEFRWSRKVKHPVTFGVRHPIVLLPRRFGDLNAEAQRAVTCHELLHVARRDWVWIVIEEQVRVVFWFHPGVWWLIGQVQLAREQLIDQLVIARTGSRHAYMDALMRFADERRFVSLSIAFLRRRDLASRFRQLSKEPHMSLRRLAWTTAVLSAVMGVTAAGVARAFPFDLPALTQGVQARLEVRLAETAPAAGLVEAVVPGSDQRLFLHPTALVTDADVTGANVIVEGGSLYSIGVMFRGAAAERMSRETAAHVGRPVAIIVDGDIIASLTVRAPIGESAVITGPFTAESARSLAARLAPGRSADAAAVGAIGPRASSPRPAASARQDGVSLPVPFSEVRPSYTAAAMAAKIEGDVGLSAMVLADGSVGEVTVTKSLDGVYGLDDEAVRAVRQWRFKPGTKDGAPVAVRIVMRMNFALK